MENTQQLKQCTNEKAENRANVKDLFQEIVEITRNSFVATYEVKNASLIMRIPNGQKFRISVEEIT